jgi:tRNA A58 N-methylase Trm61
MPPDSMPLEIVEAQSSQPVCYVAYALALLAAPEHVLETGTGIGNVTVNLQRALTHQGSGTLWTVEHNAEVAAYVHEHMLEVHEMLPGGAHYDPKIVVMDSLDFEPPDDVTFGLCWFDTPLGVEEFRYFKQHMTETATIVFASAGDDVRAELADEITLVSLPENVLVGRIGGP